MNWGRSPTGSRRPFAVTSTPRESEAGCSPRGAEGGLFGAGKGDIFRLSRRPSKSWQRRVGVKYSFFYGRGATVPASARSHGTGPGDMKVQPHSLFFFFFFIFVVTLKALG